MPEKKEETLDQWLIAETLGTAIMVLNAPFCDGGPAEGPNFKYLDYIIDHLVKHCGLMALEDAQVVIDAAVERATLLRKQNDAIAAEQVVPLTVSPLPESALPKKHGSIGARVDAAMLPFVSARHGNLPARFAFIFPVLLATDVTDVLEHVESVLDRNKLRASSVRYIDSQVVIEGVFRR